MKLSDHESDTMASDRLNPTASVAPLPSYRESWLDKLARHLGAVPVDHMPIVPRVAPSACCAAAEGG